MKFSEFWIAPHSTTQEAALDLCLELRKEFDFDQMHLIFLDAIQILLDNPQLPDLTARVLGAMVHAGVKEAVK